MINGLNKVRRGIASFSLVMIIASFFAVSVAQAATFSDVQPSDWFSPYVEQLAADGILNTSTGTYRPADLVNRAEMAKLAVEAFKLTLENPDTPTFKDVPKGSWFYQYVETAAKNGIVGGYKDQTGTLTGYFGPGDSLTREQAMKILVLAAPLTTNTKGGPHFSDVPASAWSYEYVETGYNWSVVDGYADGTFNPTKNINRAEIAKMVVNAMNPVVREGSAGYEISSVTALNATTVEVCYSVEVDATAAADKANYSIKDSSNSVLAVDSATVSADGMCVELATGTQQAATVYTLLITGVKSIADEELVTNSISFNGYSVNANGGDLTVSTDDSTPKGITLPGAVSGVPVFSFNVAAGSNDVTITSIELHRGGTGVDASVANVAIFDEANRVSKAKTFNSSTDTATVSLLSGGLVVKAGATKKLTVVATVGSTITPNVAGSEFSIEVAKAGAIASNAKTITGTFPVSGNMFKVGSSDSGVITWLDNGAPSNPKLGALQAEVSKFKLRNESNDNEMLLNGVTIKELSSGVNVDTETENWSLWIEGVKVAETAKSSSRYITFKLTTPYSIKSSKTINLVVKTDITGGAGKTLRFGLDNSLDLSATDTKYGYGAKVCYDGGDATCTYGQTGTGTVGTDYDEEVVTVQAGEVSIVSTDAANTDILKNKKNVVAGTLKVTTKAGLNLELQKIGVTVTNNDVAASVDAGASCSVAVGTYDPALRCLIENVELYDVKTGSVYDLAGVPGAAVKTFTYADSSVTIPLSAGETREFQVRFDTLNRNITGGQLVFALNNIGATGTSFYMVETGDNQAVSDVTPASISFKTLNGVAATAKVDTITMSASKEAVVGSKGVEFLSFDVTAGNASKLTMTEAKVGFKHDKQSVTTFKIVNMPLAGESINIDNGNCVIAFAVAADDADCSNNTANFDVAVYTTPATLAAKIATITGLTNYTLGTGTAADEFKLTHKGTSVAGNVALAGAAAVNTLATLGGYLPADMTATNTRVGVVTGDATNSTINTVYLWKVGTTNTLLSTKSGSLLAAGVATFDNFSTEIPLNGTSRFLVTADIVDDQSSANDILQAYTKSLKVVDYDNDDATTGTVNGTAATNLTTLVFNAAVPPIAGGDVTSPRKVTLKGIGTLSIAVKTDDLAANKDKNIVGGTLSDIVAAYELTAQNEPILVRDIEFVGGAGLQNSVSEIVLYKADKTTEIARKAVTGATTKFTDINYSVAIGSEKMYVKVMTHKIGKDEAGVTNAPDFNLTAQVTKADGGSSGKSLTATAVTGASKNFRAHAVNVSNVAFVSTATVDGVTANVDTALKAGQNTNAIVAVTAAPSTNTNTVTGGAIETELTTFAFDIDGTATACQAVEVKRLGGTGTAYATVPVNGCGVAGTLGTAIVSGPDWRIANGSVAYYTIKSTSALAAAGYAQAKFKNLTANVVFNSSQLAPITAIGVRLASNTLDGPSLEYKP